MRGHYAYYGCAGILGKKQEVKVHYDEGLAIHIDPESCAVTREGLGDALTGGRIGQVTEPRKSIILGCRRCPYFGRQNVWVRYPRVPSGPAWSKTLAYAYASCAGTGRSHGRPTAK